jgi:ATP-dependent helicase/nuclease subunit B
MREGGQTFAPAIDALQRASERACAGAVVLTSTTRASRLIARTVQQIHAANGKKVWDTPRVLPFGAWLASLWKDLQLRGLAKSFLLSSEQERKLWEQVLIASRDDSGFLASAQAAWALAAQYGIPLTSSAMSASAETRKFFAWARDFSQQCTDNNWTTQARLADELIPLLPSAELPCGVALYGFDELLPQQRTFLDHLRHAGCAVELIAPPKADPREECLLIPENETAELRIAARWARAQLERNPAAQVGVVVLGLGENRAVVEQVFTEVLHPDRAFGEIGECAFELSLGAPLSDHPMVRDALLLLDLCAGEVDWRSASSLIRSAHIGGNSREWAERAKLELKLRKVLPVRLGLSRLLSVMSAEELAPDLQSRLRAVIEKLGQVNASRSMSQWRDFAKNALQAAGWPGDRSFNSAEYQVSERWRKLLSEIAALDVVSGEVTFGDFVRELRRAAQSVVFKPESTDAPVQIMDAREASGAVFDAIWVCGATDQALPASARPNPFLPFALQQEAGVPSANIELQRKHAEAMLGRLAASAKEIVFSSPRQEDDRQLRCSALLAGVHVISESALTLSAENTELMSQRGAAMPEALETRAPAIDEHEQIRGGTNLLKHQSNCPFRAFAELRLGARQVDEPAEGLTPIDRGELVERVLENVWTELKDSAKLMSSDLVPVIERAISKTFAAWPTPLDAWTRAHFELERERLRIVVQEWLELERKRTTPFRVIMQQQDLQLQLAGRTLKGRADRVDRVDGGVIVIDYKTGSSTQLGPAQWLVPRIELPQLPFYAAQLMSQGEPVLGVAFARVRRGDARFSGYAASKEVLPLKSDMVKKHADGDYHAHVAKWRPALEQIAQDFLSGEAAVNPLRWPDSSNSTCAQCHLQSLCRVSELSASVGEDEEDADE